MKHGMFARGVAWALVLVALVGLGCRSWGGDEPAAVATAQEEAPALSLRCEGETTLLFDPRPEVQEVPWPTDLLTVPDAGTHTGLRLALSAPYPPIMREVLTNVSFMREAAQAADGFSTTSRIFIPASGDLDPASLPDYAQTLGPGASVQVLVADGGSAHHGERVLCDVLYRPQLAHLQIKPVLPLEGATRHVVVVTRDVRDAAGDRVCPSPSFEYLKRRAPDPGAPGFADLEPLRASYQEIFEFLEALPEPIDRSRVALAFAFTTTDTTTDMSYISQYLVDRARDYPPEPFELSYAPSGRGGLSIEVRGRFFSPNFRDEGGVFHYNPTTRSPQTFEDEALEFVLLLPAPEAGAAAQPFPVILGLHGINASKNLVFALSEQLGRNAFAAVATDFVWHGSRADPNAVMDGLKFLDIGHPLVMRDNIRQSVVDQLQTIQLVKALGDLDLYPHDPATDTYGDGVPDLDTEHILLWGHSLGGILAPMILALSPDVEVGVTAPAAGQWTDTAEYSYYAKLIVSILRALLLPGLEFPESLRLLFDVANIALDPADNLNYVRHAVSDPLPVAGGPKYLLIAEAIGDQTLPNESTETLGVAAGVPLGEPYVQAVGGMRTLPLPIEGSALVQFATDNHGYYFAGDEFGEAARLQADVYWRSYLRDGVPLVIDPFDPAQVPDWMR